MYGKYLSHTHKSSGTTHAQWLQTHCQWWDWWLMADVITQEWICIGCSSLVEGLTT